MARALTCHELHHVLVRLDEDHVDALRVALFQLLLQESTPVLVFAKSKDLSLQMLKLSIVEACIF